jgi:IS30 family transposase
VKTSETGGDGGDVGGDRRCLVHLPGSHDAHAVCNGLISVLNTLPETARRTLTWDQGSEMALHELLAPQPTAAPYA